MEFCDLHKNKCDNVIHIIEFKNNKIKESNICLDCLCNFLNLNYFDLNNLKIKELKNLTNRCPDCDLNKKDLYSSKLLCNTCYEYFKVTKKEDKINLIKNKMAAAIEVEDYETAAIFKKEIERIKNS
jgi:protein-arginine kinase activator protein McsA